MYNGKLIPKRKVTTIYELEAIQGKVITSKCGL